MFNKNTLLRIFLPILLFSMVTFWACENSIKPEEAKVTLDGTITDSQNLPVPFAIVSIYDISSKTSLLTEKKIASDTTDEDGKYSLSGIPESMTNLVLKVNHTNYPEFASGLTDLKTKITSDKKLPIKMNNNADCNASLNFNITDKLTSIAINDAQIRITQNGTLLKKAYTNANGKLSLTNICEGTYGVRVAKEGYAVFEKSVNVVKGDSLQLAYPLLSNTSNPNDTCCGGSVGITVNGPDDKPLTNVNVKINFSNKQLLSKLTADLGKVSFEKLCEGKYFVSLSKEGYLESNQDFINLGCNSKIDNIVYKMQLKKKDSTKCCTGKVTINLKDSLKNKLNTKVSIKINGTIKGPFLTKDGTITFDELCDGEEIRVLISDNDTYFGNEFNFVTKCDTVVFDKTLSKKPVKCCDGTFTLNLLDSSKKAVNGQVKLLINGTYRGPILTKDGSVTFDGLCDGDSIKVLVFVDGFETRSFYFVAKCGKNISETLTYASKPCCDGVIDISLKDSNGLDLRANYRLTLKGSTFVKEGKIEKRNQLITGLCEGTYHIVFTSDSLVSSEEDVVVTCAKPVVVAKFMKYNYKCCDGVLSITPKDSTTLMDLNGGTIRLYKGKDLVDTKIVENGKVKFDHLCEGEYSFSFNLQGYKSFEAKVVITCKNPAEFPLLLSKSTCCDNKLTVNVKDLEGNLLNDVSIDLALNDKVVKSGSTNNGTANFDGLCEGTYVVRLKKAGYADSLTTVTISCGKSAEVLGRLRKAACCSATAKFVPKDSLGNVLNGATVKLYQGSTLIKTGKVDGGKLVFDGLCEGEYTYSITIDGYKGIEGKFVAKCDTPFATDPTLYSNSKCCNATLKVTVQDDSTKATITGATVNLYLNGTLVATKITVPTADFSGLCDGNTYTYSITKNGYTSYEDKVSISCNDKKEITKTIKFIECCNATMKFLVKDDSLLTAIANAKVEISYGGVVLKSGLTNGDGYFMTDGMCKRNYSYRITKDGYLVKEGTWNITDCILYFDTFKLKRK